MPFEETHVVDERTRFIEDSTSFGEFGVPVGVPTGPTQQNRADNDYALQQDARPGDLLVIESAGSYGAL